MEEVRNYKNLPDPNKKVKEFNQYLLDNNKVIGEYIHWILIKNSYIKYQYVLFCKLNRKYLGDISVAESMELHDILSLYKGKEIYINPDHLKSVPDRLHLHIRI